MINYICKKCRIKIGALKGSILFCSCRRKMIEVIRIKEEQVFIEEMLLNIREQL